MVEPTSFENSLAEAEDACFAEICKWLDVRAGTTAFIGVNEGRPDCVVFDIGSPYTGDLTTYRASNFHFRGTLDLYNRNRRTLQAQLMSLLGAMPIQKYGGMESDLRDTSNVIQFRIVPETNCITPISTTSIETATAGKSMATYTATVNFDIVFKAGERTLTAAADPDGNDGEESDGEDVAGAE